MMTEHGIQFSRAHEFDAPAPQALAVATIKRTLEYDAK
jgi:hypothetical protein